VRPTAAADGNKVGPGAGERGVVVGPRAAGADARHRHQGGPPLYQREGCGRGLRIVQVAEQNIVGACFGDAHRLVAGSAAGSDDAVGDTTARSRIVGGLHQVDAVGSGRDHEIGAAVEEKGDVAPPGDRVQRRRASVHELAAGVRRAAQENGRDVGGGSGVVQLCNQLRRGRLVADPWRCQEDAAGVRVRRGWQADPSRS
jgi:hypothetical protein